MKRKTKKPQISICSSVGLGIIIEYPTGIMISNQTGGNSCLQPKTEGILLPLLNDYRLETREFLSPEIELTQYFTEAKHKGTGATYGLDVDDVDKINSILSKFRLDDFIKIDQNRLMESHEAWVRIKIHKSQKNDLIKGFHEYPLNGILTWSNSD